MCYFEYDNPKNESYYGCVSKETPVDPSTQSASADLGSGKVQYYCSANPNCIGYYSSPNNWNIATDTDPIKCTESIVSNGFTKFQYKQKVL